MKVFCTGATGFVGAHTALALASAGHQLRLLVRNEPCARDWFDTHGGRVDDFVTVDIGDQAALERAMAGCDAVFHAAAAVSLDARRAQQVYDNNVGATKAVLGAARALGIGNMLYVSSVMALFRPDVPRLDENTPLADLTEPYSRSKRDSEDYVRELQRQGLPVQISYPAGVIGPDDPKLSAANRALAAMVGQLLPRSTTGFQCVDVRDLARMHVWLMEHPVTAAIEDARYIVGGHFYPWDELRLRLEALLGRRLVSPRVSPRLMRAAGAITDRVKRVFPFDTQITGEAMLINTRWSPADSSRITTRSALSFRTPEETFADTIRWMSDAGHIPRKKAGRLVSAGAPNTERHGAP